VIVAADWWGMSSPDRNVVLEDLTSHPDQTLRFTDRLHQGMANFMALSKAAKGDIASLPELQINGQPAYDASEIYFYGISMGHILGGTFVGLSPDVHRAVIASGGADFSLLMFRAQPFAPFLALISLLNDDLLDHQKFAALVQPAFDRVDPLTYAPYILKEQLEGGPTDRKLLMQLGYADSTVPNLAGYYHARVIGLPVLSDASPLVPLGLEGKESPIDGSALTIFDFGIEPEVKAVPSDTNDIHNTLRNKASSKRQVSDFLRPDGMIENPCDGVCDPE
jgi:hypothetical protein